MRLKLLSLALALSAISLPSHGEDLLDAYREARANDPVLSQADAQRLSVGENVNQARALLLPQLSAGLSLSQTSSTGASVIRDPATGEVVQTSQNLGHSRTRDISGNLSQTVLDLSKIADLRAAHSQANAQDALYQAALQELFVRVSTAYFNVLTSQDQLAYAKANEDAFKQQYEQSDQRFKVGLSAITDVYQAKSYYESAKAQTIAAQNTLDDAREALTQITGKPTGDLKQLRNDLPMTPPVPNDQQAWVDQALQNNPNILSQKYSVAAAEHSINAARAGHLPTINANVSYGKSATWYQNSNLHFRNPSSTTIGLTLSVPIFEGGATQSRVRQSIYQRDAAEDSLESQRRLVTRDTLNYYRSVLSGISQVEAAQAAVEAGQKALDATRAGFGVGTKTILDVLTSIQTLTQSESQYSQARHQFILDKLLLKQSTGTADIKDIEAINALLE
ncbi:TolC family outer membrane protein [Dyella sp.]|jgi:outer membrane protein|uniref:TolC family outer membrane protein n=1 Tax=Dyella sp. TaxID=1869338 RepID=UPI002D79894F|nr:TolC family outer membrane protein [Dyella sp.]HET6430753.1 TolC family outer membrane protein [Dyella sp.]